MAKTGLKSTHGFGSAKINDIKTSMKRQASNQKSMAYGASLNLSVDSSRGRRYVVTIINGVSVKRFI